MNEPIMRLTDGGRNVLLELAKEDPELWLNPDTDFAAELRKRGASEYAEATGALANGVIELPTGEGYGAQTAPRMDRHAPAFADILRNLTPLQASDSQMWEWLANFRLHRFAVERWPRVRGGDLQRHIWLHWFIRNLSGNVYQDNTASRLYWVGKLSERLEAASGGRLARHRVAEHLSENPITYHSAMRSSMTHNPRMAALVLDALMTPGRGEGISSDGAINLWKRLNLSAGKILPEALSDSEWSEIIDEHLDEIMRVKEYVRRGYLPRGVEPYRVLSLGAGAQSTVMALMAERGEFGMSKPDIAIFADTQWETRLVYEHLEWLRSQVSFEIRTVTAGNIKENLRKGVMPNGSKFVGMPVFMEYSDGRSGIMRRQCTAEYKLRPIHQELRKILGLKPRQPVPKDVKVEMWVGISVDEIDRAKPSQEGWIEKKFPLIDRKFSRAQLHGWFQERYPERTLPKSACIGCPYHSDGVWKDMKDNDPDSFMDAIEVDIELRSNPNITALVPDARAYLHRSRKPLALVDFSGAKGYQDQMNDECDGLCGI